jgi:hypothetical protein
LPIRADQMERRHALDATKPRREHHLLEACHRREPERLTGGRATEERTGRFRTCGSCRFPCR